MDRTNLETTEKIDVEIAIDESISTGKIKKLLKAMIDQTIADYISNRSMQIYGKPAGRQFEKNFIKSNHPLLHMYCQVFNISADVFRRRMFKLFNFVESQELRKEWKKASFSEKKNYISEYLK